MDYACNMSLTAREWILLPKGEMEARKGELSPEECLKLRIDLDMVHFTEEEKQQMSEEEKYRFTHPKESTEEEKEAFRKMQDTIYRVMDEHEEKMIQKYGEHHSVTMETDEDRKEFSRALDEALEKI